MIQGTAKLVAGDSKAADAGDGESVLAAFEARAGASKQARRWAMGVGAAVMLLGLAAMFHFSAATAVRVAETASRAMAEKQGFQTACLVFATALLVAITAARATYALVTAKALSDALRRSAVQLNVAALVAAPLAFGLTLLTFAISYGMQAAKLSEWAGQWERARLPSIGFAEGLVAAAVAAGAAYLLSRAAGGESLEDENDEPLARRRATAAGVGVAAMLLVAIASLYAAEAFTSEGISAAAALLLGALVGGVTLLSIRPRKSNFDEEAARAAADDAVVQGALQDMRRASQQRWIARGLSGLAGVGTAAVGVYLTNLWAASLPSYSEQPGLMTFIAIIAAAVLAGLWVNKRLSPNADLEDWNDIAPHTATGGVFDETLATTSGLTVTQERTLGGLLFGDVAGQSFQLVDGGGVWCGNAKEESSLWSRLLLRGRRPLAIVVDDLGEAALRVSRPLVLFAERAAVTVGERAIGEIKRSWSPLRKVYRACDAAGSERYTLVSGWIFTSRLRVMQNGAAVGELRRLRKPWYQRMFASDLVPQQDRFALTFPEAADMDERRLLLGALFLVDASG